MNTQKIIEKIRKYEYVSFDIFDTLIKRYAGEPADVFDFTAIAYENAWGRRLESFRRDRCEAEERARGLSPTEDVTLEAVYAQLKGYDAETVERLRRLECETELSLCCVNRDFLPVYRFCLQQHKQIVLISDMYHSTAFIRKLLDRCGISGYRQTYVSSEYGLNKRSGHLYPLVLRELGIRPGQIVHIGDSRRADFAMPRLHGVRSIFIQRGLTHLRYYDPTGLSGRDLLLYRHIAAFVSAHAPRGRSDEYKTGYETFGILLYAFSEWLIRDLQEKGIGKVFFLARDGQIMKKAFDLINANPAIRSVYLYASRRSVLVPALPPAAPLGELLSTLSIRRVESVDGFLFRVGLEPSDYAPTLQKHGLTGDLLLRDVESTPEFAAFLRELRGDMVANSERERANLLGYLREQDFAGRLALVDIGWRGAIQHALTGIAEKCGLPAEIFGYYMGMNREAAAYVADGMACRGFLFDSGSDYDAVLAARSFQGLFETFFFAEHGSTICYEGAARRYAPQLETCEYAREDCRRVGEIQQGALDFIRDYIRLPLKGVEITPRAAAKSLMNLGTAPSLADLRRFGGLSYYDTKVMPLAAPKNVFHYLFHPRQLATDFSMSDWKVGFMKGLLRLPLPYLSLYRRMKKRDDSETRKEKEARNA